MLFCPDHGDPERLFPLLPDDPGNDVRHEIERDVLFDEGVTLGNSPCPAKRLKRRYLGIDVSEIYCKKSELRLKELLDSYVSL